MDKPQKEALQVAKEIVVKFIETNRVSTANFAEVFPMVYYEVLRTITTDPAGAPAPRAAGSVDRDPELDL